MFVGRSIYQV